MEIPNTRKYILIPEYKPLFAMRKCFGPPHGPLLKPCPTSLDIIGELLTQSGNDALTVMEVVPTATGYSEPVRLTPENYKLPYEEIAAALKGEQKPGPTVPPPSKTIEPEVMEENPEPAPSLEEPEVPAKPETSDEDLPGYTMGPTPPVPETPVTIAEGTVKTDGYPGYAACGMSKKEWKAAKAKEAAEPAAAEN